MWKESDDRESMRALHKSVDLGVNFIDTALAYGQGHSERLVGRLLKERKENIFYATKIPPKNGRWPAKPGSTLRDVFPHDYIIRCTEESLRNLGVDTIHVQQFHVWSDDWTDESEWQDAVGNLKEQGKIRFFGISINDHEPENALKLVATGTIDTVQVIYNIFDQSPEDRLFPSCLDHNIGVIVRVPFDEGALTGSITPHTVFPPGDFRRQYFRGKRKEEVYARVGELKKKAGGEARSLAELALRFCLNHPAVSTVIPGMRRIQNVESNCAVPNRQALSASQIAELRSHRWDRNFYTSPHRPISILKMIMKKILIRHKPRSIH